MLLALIIPVGQINKGLEQQQIHMSYEYKLHTFLMRFVVGRGTLDN